MRQALFVSPESARALQRLAERRDLLVEDLCRELLWNAAADLATHAELPPTGGGSSHNMTGPSVTRIIARDPEVGPRGDGVD